MADKTAYLHVKLVASEKNAIKREAKKYKVSVSEYVRALAYNIMENEKLNKAAKENK